MRAPLNSLLRGRPERAADAALELFGPIIEELSASISGALAGNDADVRAYVAAYDKLLRAVLGAIHDHHSGLVAETERGLLPVDAKGIPSGVAEDLLVHTMVRAPFSPWVEKFGPGHGVAVYLVSEIREAVPGCPPLALPRDWAVFPHVELDDRSFARFARKVWWELERSRASPIETIMQSFDLTKTEFGRLFGVRRQAVDQWIANGIPPAREPKVTAIAAIAELLGKKLKADRVPGIVRRSADAYGGVSLLEAVRNGRHEQILGDLRHTFDWAVTA